MLWSFDSRLEVLTRGRGEKVREVRKQPDYVTLSVRSLRRTFITARGYVDGLVIP